MCATNLGSGAVSGQDALGLFSESGLPRDVLARIWDVADSGRRGSLSLDDFSVALRLISLAQRSGAVATSREELATRESALPFAMPTFDSPEEDEFGEFDDAPAPPPVATKANDEEEEFGDFDVSEPVDTIKAPALTLESDDLGEETKDEKSALDNMLGAALRGESIATKKPPARIAAPVLDVPAVLDVPSPVPAFVDNAHASKLSVFDAMADLDVAAATETWDDFADATRAEASDDFGAFSVSAGGDDGGSQPNDFGAFSVSAGGDDGISQANEFGAFSAGGDDGISQAKATDDDGGSQANKFGAFSTAGDDGGSHANEFGAFSAGGDDGISQAKATDDDGGSQANEFGAFSTAGDDGGSHANEFGAFSAMGDDGVSQAKAMDDFGVFSVSAGGNDGGWRANDDDFGAFSAGGKDGDGSQANDDDFGAFSAGGNNGGGSQANNDDFGAFSAGGNDGDGSQANDDDFGAFSAGGNYGDGSQANNDDFGAFSAGGNDGLGDAPHEFGAFDVDFGDFDGPKDEANGITLVDGQRECGLPKVPDNAERPATSGNKDEAGSEGVGRVPVEDDAFASIAAAAQGSGSLLPEPSPKNEEDDVLEEVGEALVRKRWYAEGAAWVAAARRRSELEETKIAMDAAAKELRFEDAITLRSRAAALEAQRQSDDAAEEARRRKARGVPAVAISDALRAVREADPAAARRLGASVRARVAKTGMILSDDDLEEDVDRRLARLEAAEAAAVQRLALDAAGAALYARAWLGGEPQVPPPAWVAVVRAAVDLVDRSLPALREIAALIGEDPTVDDRNRAKKLDDHILALRKAVAVARWVRDAATRAAYDPPAGTLLDAAASELDSIAADLLLAPDHPRHHQEGPSSSFEPPASADALRALPPATCALTLRSFQDDDDDNDDDDVPLHYEGTPFLAPVINFWLNLVSTTPPADYREPPP
ncbi:hypothetical protein CTAYLR_004928 [Chrysophaeum taylorii]|uniref:EH domain-containing protein n=1 Tax=Chrysophaeum taylorii TaxID=2483200 RepID=A0AAD7UPD4_9STRA|nr:hypothetical protein CTAYLR_004928 [Chrysophaeum taylorii]